MSPQETDPPQVYHVHKIKRSEFLGIGCVVQGLGILIGLAAIGALGVDPLLALIIGSVALVVLIIGSRLAFKWTCQHCGNRVEKSSRMCPVCRCYFIN